MKLKRTPTRKHAPRRFASVTRSARTVSTVLLDTVGSIDTVADLDFVTNMPAAADVSGDLFDATTGKDLPLLALRLALNVDYVGGYVGRKLVQRSKWKEFSSLLVETFGKFFRGLLYIFKLYFLHFSVVSMRL